MAEMSDRTFATYWRAFRLLGYLRDAGAITEDEQRAAMSRAIRPNGSINVCKFARNSEMTLMQAMIQRPELFDDQDECQ